MSAPPTFVGRGRELAALIRALYSGTTQIWLLVGPAGIGKTRLAEELAHHASANGHLVAWGQCWDESSSPPFWPWTQALRQLLVRRTSIGLQELLQDALDAGPDADEFDLFDATSIELGRIATDAPLLVVLDDLHRADPATLGLTRFLVTHLRGAPVTIVATMRQGDVHPRTDVEALLDSLRDRAHLVELGGLDLDAVEAMIGGGEAEEVRVVTGGNPLYIRHLLDSAAVRRLPRSAGRAGRTGLVEMLRDRLSRLTVDELELLAALSVLGPNDDHGAPAALLERTPEDLEPVTHALRDLSLIDPQRLSLAHPLVGEVVESVVPDDRLEGLHLAAARYAVQREAPPAERAHHLCRAGTEHGTDAVDACREAARAAADAQDHINAAAHLAAALEVLARQPGTDREQFEVAFDLAGAVERANGSVAAEAAHRRSHDLARRTGDPALIARAAARHGLTFFAKDDARRSRARDCRAALAAVPVDDDELRSRLMANLVAADPADPDRVALADDAVAIARRLEDPETLAIALVAQQIADLGPTTLERRLRTSREIIAAAEATGLSDLEVRGRFLLKNALLEAGDTRGLDAELIAQDRSITEIGETRFARHSLWFRCTRALLDGRATDAEKLAAQCLTISQELQDPDGFGVYTGQYGAALWLQGRLTELEPIYLDLMRDEPDDPLWPAVVGWIALQDGRADTARGLLDRLPPPDEMSQGMHTLLNLFTLADIAAAVGDDHLVASLRDALLPYADRAVPVAMGAACFGVVARPLGLLAVRLGLIDEGIDHLEHAVAVAARMGARPWLVDAQIALAEVLTEARLDDKRVEQLVFEASRTARKLDLVVFDGRLARLTAHAVPGSAGTAAPTPEPPGDVARRARVDVLGTFEVRTIDGDVATWTSRKARSLLKILVARRGAPIAREQAMDLLWPGTDPDGLANRLAVAVSAVRRALDPDRCLPSDSLIRAEGGSLQLVHESLDVDVEAFLRGADEALTAEREDRPDAADLLERALAAHRGEALPDEPYEPWAEALRSETATAYRMLLRATADRAERAGDSLRRSDCLLRLVDLDPYDEMAHLQLIETLRTVGAHGQAAAARTRYRTNMAEIGVPVRPDPAETW